MAIKWFNIRSKEVRVAETEPQITAMWASSDHSPNITQGQDFGWRLAPEIVVEMKRITRDEQKLIEIAHRFNMLPEDVGEADILAYISSKYDERDAPIANDADYSDEYYAEIKAIEDRQKESDVATAQTVTTTTTESLADLEKRVELEERLAAAKAKRAEETTTTTTTVAPTTTTTTTKAK